MRGGGQNIPTEPNRNSSTKLNGPEEPILSKLSQKISKIEWIFPPSNRNN